MNNLIMFKFTEYHVYTLFATCCVYKEKIVKNDSYEERSVYTNSENCNIQPEL